MNNDEKRLNSTPPRIGNCSFGAVRLEGSDREHVMMFPDWETLAHVMENLPFEHSGGVIVSARPIDGDEAAEIGAL